MQVQELIEKEGGILFLDELSCARPAVQGAGLSVVYERRIAGRRLPGRVRVVAAANPPEEAAGGWQLTPPMANRFIHLNVNTPSVEEWTTWLLQGTQSSMANAMHHEEIIRQKWDDVWPSIRGLAAGFMRSNSGKLYAMPPSGHKDRGRAWPSPRSWEKLALRCIATCEILGRKDLSIELIEGSVGPGIAAEWIEWVAKANLPSPEEMLNNGWEPDKRRLDVAFAAYSSAIAWVLEKKDKVEQEKFAIKAWKLLQLPILKLNMADLALAPAASLMKAGFHSQKGREMLEVSRYCIKRFGTSGLANHVPRN
jgi:hypothetical protein